jgi:hypothetical protein
MKTNKQLEETIVSLRDQIETLKDLLLNEKLKWNHLNNMYDSLDEEVQLNRKIINYFLTNK